MDFTSLTLTQLGVLAENIALFPQGSNASRPGGALVQVKGQVGLDHLSESELIQQMLRWMEVGIADQHRTHGTGEGDICAAIELRAELVRRLGPSDTPET
jgi:hypothetical protein